jgi:hypothetical protein
MKLPICAGDSFLADPSGQNCFHLWVILAIYVPDLDDSEWALIVNVTSMTKLHDPACILNATDPDRHPFVHHDSYVSYVFAREVEMKWLLAIPEKNRHAPVMPELLGRMRHGLHKSRFTKRRLKSLVPLD